MNSVPRKSLVFPRNIRRRWKCWGCARRSPLVGTCSHSRYCWSQGQRLVASSMEEARLVYKLMAEKLVTIPTIPFDLIGTFVETSPSGNESRSADKIDVAGRRQANGDNVGLESDRVVEAEQSEIVLESARVELRMRSDDLNFTLNVWIFFLICGQIVLAHPQQQIVRLDTGETEPVRKSTTSRERK